MGLSKTSFGYFGGYFFGNFRKKASIVCSACQSADKDQQDYKKAVLWQGNRMVPL